MKNRILPCLLLALLAATFARAQQDYYLRGNDTDNNCSFNGSGSPYGWATSSGGAKVSNGPTDATGVYHVDGYLVRINLASTTSLTFAGGEFVFDAGPGGVPAMNQKMANNSTMTIPKLRVPSGTRAEFRQGGDGGNDGTNKYLEGTNWVVEAGAELCINVGEDGTRYWTCNATILGEGLLSAGSGMTESRVWVADKADGGGSVTLAGDLAGFAGFLSTGEYGVTYTGTKSHADVVSKLKLVIGAAQAMPQ